MNKHKILMFALALSFSAGIFSALPTSAIDETVNSEIIVSGDEDPMIDEGEIYTEDPNNTPVTTNETAPIAQPEEDCNDTDNEDCQDETERYDTDLENAIDEGLANEPEVICATGDEEDCNNLTDSEMWPLYISLGALGVTIVLVIIINLIGRKKK